MNLSPIKRYVIKVITRPREKIFKPLKTNFLMSCFLLRFNFDLLKLRVREIPTKSKKVVPIG